MPRNKSRITITLDEKLLRNIDGLIDGVKIKNRSHAIECFLLKNLRQKKIRIAVILAGGKGICLNEKTTPISKVMVEYEGEPVIFRNLSWLQEQGIEKVYIIAGKFTDSIRNEVGAGFWQSLDISFISGDSGTAGSLKFINGLIDGTFILINGDVFCEAKIDEIYDFHKKMGGYCTICMTSKKEPHCFGSIKLNGNRVVDFIEKPENGKEQSYLINGGIYMFEPIIPKIIAKSGYRSLERDLFPALSKEGKIYGYYLEEKWSHI